MSHKDDIFPEVTDNNKHLLEQIISNVVKFLTRKSGEILMMVLYRKNVFK